MSGETFGDALAADTQNYVAVPDQPWLDGVNAGDGNVRQFVAVPLGEGLTVEAQLTGEEVEGGLQFALHAPKPGRFPDEPPADERFSDGVMCCYAPLEDAAPMGLGAGGRMTQEIYEDDHGIDTWEPEPTQTATVELVDAALFAAVTGLAVPAPVDASAYTEAGLRWFSLEADARALEVTEKLAGIRSIAELEGRVEDGFAVPVRQVQRLIALREDVVRPGH